jgi:outer membrane protein assembly factor BamA
VKATVQPAQGDPHRVIVAYAINERQLVRINEVVYLGQKRTRLPLIARTAQIPAESPMRRGELLAAESRLYDLNIFDWSSVGPRRPITDQTDEEALVKVHEAKRNEISYGIGFEVAHRGGNVPGGTVALPGGGGTIGLGNNQIAPSQSTFASPRGLIEFNRRNIRGLGETGSASILGARLDQKFLTTYTQPHFIGSNWQSLSSFSLERNSENPLFTAGLGDLSFQVERLVSRKSNTRLQLRYDFNKTSLSNLLVPELVLEQDRHVRLSTFSGSLIRQAVCSVRLLSAGSLSGICQQHSLGLRYSFFRQFRAHQPAVLFGRRDFTARVSYQRSRSPAHRSLLQRSQRPVRMRKYHRASRRTPAVHF